MFPFRLSSIDMKYHIWKLGVVFTDNVSMASGKAKFCAPSPGMSLDATKKQAMEAAQEDAGSAGRRQGALGCWGDTSLLCSSMRQMGLDLAIPGPAQSTSVPWMPEKLLNFFHFHSPFSTSPGTRPCQSWATTTTSSSLLICWISRWASRLWGPFCHLSLTMANRYGVYTAAEQEGPR